MKVKVRPPMRDIEKEQDKNKAWDHCRRLVVYSIDGQWSGDLRCKDFVEYLVNPSYGKDEGPWVPVVHRDTLHLIHPVFTHCEGSA